MTTILITIYTVISLYNVLYLFIAHYHKRGIFKTISLHWLDIVISIFPIINIPLFTKNLSDSPTEKKLFKT